MHRAMYVFTAVLIVGCSRGAELTQPDRSLSADRSSAARYSIVTLPLVGGTLASGEAINDRGEVAGFGATAAGTFTAVIWQNGVAKTLGTLGGPNSEVQWPGLNNRGTVVGFAERAELSPLGEHWSCSAFFPTITGHICRGFAWRDDHMVEMPTFGGDNSFATEVNERGRVVGWAETPVHDPTCHAPQVLQFRAMVWDPETGRVRALPPLYGDSTSAATAINDRDQIVGISGACDTAVAGISARAGVMWDHDEVIDIGGLGGTAFNTPMAINNSGVVVGFSDTTGDQNGAAPNFQAFIWTRDKGIKNLKSLPQDVISEALGINSQGQVVGVSIGASAHAVIWEHNAMYNLQSFLPAGYPDSLQVAQDINDEGQITGQLKQTSTGNLVTFIMTPMK